MNLLMESWRKYIKEALGSPGSDEDAGGEAEEFQGDGGATFIVANPEGITFDIRDALRGVGLGELPSDLLLNRGKAVSRLKPGARQANFFLDTGEDYEVEVVPVIGGTPREEYAKVIWDSSNDSSWQPGSQRVKEVQPGKNRWGWPEDTPVSEPEQERQPATQEPEPERGPRGTVTLNSAAAAPIYLVPEIFNGQELGGARDIKLCSFRGGDCGRGDTTGSWPVGTYGATVNRPAERDPNLPGRAVDRIEFEVDEGSTTTITVDSAGSVSIQH